MSATAFRNSTKECPNFIWSFNDVIVMFWYFKKPSSELSLTTHTAAWKKLPGSCKLPTLNVWVLLFVIGREQKDPHVNLQPVKILRSQFISHNVLKWASPLVFLTFFNILFFLNWKVKETKIVTLLTFVFYMKMIFFLNVTEVRVSKYFNEKRWWNKLLLSIWCNNQQSAS